MQATNYRATILAVTLMNVAMVHTTALTPTAVMLQDHLYVPVTTDMKTHPTVLILMNVNETLISATTTPHVPTALVIIHVHARPVMTVMVLLVMTSTNVHKIPITAMKMPTAPTT